MTTARERYYFNHHTNRLILWQLAQVENANRERREKVRKIREAHKRYKLGIARIIRANVEFYNRAIAKGY